MDTFVTDAIIELLQEWGIWGVLLSMIIEGTAFPFIGTFFIVTVGFVLELPWLDIFWISLLGSFLYAAGSYIPYYLGYKLENLVQRKLSPSKKANLEKATAAFNKYGIWSVAIASPLHLGNVIPFLAGMARMNLLHYTLLTMLGIAPTTFLLLSLGRFYTGDTETVIAWIEDYQYHVLIGFVVVTAAYMGWKGYRQHRGKKGIDV